MLSKEVSSTILKDFGMTRPRIEPRSPGPLANTVTTKGWRHILLLGQKFRCFQAEKRANVLLTPNHLYGLASPSNQQCVMFYDEYSLTF